MVQIITSSSCNLTLRNTMHDASMDKDIHFQESSFPSLEKWAKETCGYKN